MRPLRFVVIGGGPGGNSAVTYAARQGVEATTIEKDMIGGAVHLRDCIPSKVAINDDLQGSQDRVRSCYRGDPRRLSGGRLLSWSPSWL